MLFATDILSILDAVKYLDRRVSKRAILSNYFCILIGRYSSWAKDGFFSVFVCICNQRLL